MCTTPNEQTAKAESKKVYWKIHVYSDEDCQHLLRVLRHYHGTIAEAVAAAETYVGLTRGARDYNLYPDTAPGRLFGAED